LFELDVAAGIVGVNDSSRRHLLQLFEAVARHVEKSFVGEAGCGGR
jgi:hypothetical protein